MFARLQKTFQSGLNSAVAATRDGVNRALPGNPALRDYDVGEQVGTGGTNGAWDIYNAVKKSNKAKELFHPSFPRLHSGFHSSSRSFNDLICESKKSVRFGFSTKIVI